MIRRLSLSLTLLLGVGLLVGRTRGGDEPAKSAASAAPAAAGDLIDLPLELPKPAYKETPKNIPAGMKVETLGDAFDAGPDAFLDAAAVMESLDLVISSDTAVAHLAGALGRPVWLALKKVPEWRWQLHRADSPWYPTMRLFRQTTRNDWRGVFADMEAALEQELGGDVKQQGEASGNKRL